MAINHEERPTMTIPSRIPPSIMSILFSVPTSLLACQPILGDLPVSASDGLSSGGTALSGTAASSSTGAETTGWETATSTSSDAPSSDSTGEGSTGEGATESGATESGSTGACAPAFMVTEYKYPTYSESDGAGPGGGELFVVSGSIKPSTSLSGILEIRAHKYPGAPEPLFDARPYQVRVSEPDTDPCGPDAFYFVISNDSPTGIGTGEIVFTFESNWLPEQTEKNYCVTASMTPSDSGYDDKYPVQQSWWWSEKIVVKRCE